MLVPVASQMADSALMEIAFARDRCKQAPAGGHRWVQAGINECRWGTTAWRWAITSADGSALRRAGENKWMGQNGREALQNAYQFCVSTAGVSKSVSSAERYSPVTQCASASEIVVVPILLFGAILMQREHARIPQWGWVAGYEWSVDSEYLKCVEQALK